MRFDERFLDELKSRLRLSDVIGRSVKLRRQGREYVGLSPFAKEKTPSFFVNDDKGFFHDFSSGKHGDLIGFLQETERLSFPEAVARLAAEAGMALPEPDARAVEVEARRATLGEWLVEASRWFEAQLRRPGGETARRYLERRGLEAPVWERFALGFAPAGRTGLKDHLIAKGALPGELVEAGLLIAPEDGAAPYDRFRDRIIFPIADGRGRIVSFGGRALDPAARAKYLNGPETPLFHKGGTLYGLVEARKLLHAEDVRPPDAELQASVGLVVVEGYMDVIACQRAGIAAVAPLGTALTEEQMEALWRLAAEPALSFDGDAAGRRAAWRVLDRALPLLKPGRSFRFAAPQGGKDPDEVLRERGASALRAELARTRPFVEMLFEREREAAAPLDTPERRAGLKVTLRKLAATIADADLSQSYRQDLLQRFEALWTLEHPARTFDEAARAFRSGRGARRPARITRNDATPEAAHAARRMAQAPHKLAAALALGALRHPALIDDRFEAMNIQGFCDVELESLARDMISIRIIADGLDSQALRHQLANRGHAASLDGLQWAAERANAAFLRDDAPLEVVRALWSQAFDALMRFTALDRALHDAKSDLERDPDFPTFMRIKAERDAMRRAIGEGTFSPADGSGNGRDIAH